MHLKIIFIAALGFIFAGGYSQNYLGYSKNYVIKALKSQRKDMTGPIAVKAVNDNFIFYISKDARRIIYYYFKVVPVKAADGKTTQEEICFKYFSKNMCQSQTKCPEVEEVIKSLNSHFTSQGQNIWIDRSKSVPHEWVIVREIDYFEVHVSELEK